MLIFFPNGAAPDDPVEGGQIHKYQWSKNLHAMGHEIVTLAGPNTNRFTQTIPKRKREVIRMLRAADVVYCRLEETPNPATQLSRWPLRWLIPRRTALVWEFNVSLRGASNPEKPRDERQIESDLMVLRNCARRVDAGICVTPALGQQVRDVLHLEHCHVIQNGSDPEIFRPDVPSPPNWRHDPDRLQVAFSAAGVNTYHDMELVQKLASEIDRRQLPIVLHLFGRCVELVASPSPDSMRLHGPVLFKDLPAYLANVDVGLTLYNEHAHFNSPLKMFDYLAAGCIPVCSESSAIRDVLDGTGVGFVADWTAESLANQLLEIQRDGPQRETMQQAGRALIEREYSWRRIAEKTEVILADCLRRRQ